MAGSVVDLSVPGTTFPNPISVDTNLLVERLIHPFFGTASGASPFAARAAQFFHELNARQSTGIVTPTAFNEFVHVAIQTRYKQELRALGGTAGQIRRYGRPINNWKVLYKIDPGVLRSFMTDLRLLRHLLIANGLIIFKPSELGAIGSGRGFDEELIHTIGTFGLDANDAAILIESACAGTADVITLDVDLQRARPDYNIYTWF